jgi:hypothetical protein
MTDLPSTSGGVLRAAPRGACPREFGQTAAAGGLAALHRDRRADARDM